MNLSSYAINAATVALALAQQANRPLANPHELFPWLHGLHPQNALQQAFFTNRNPRKPSRREACRPPPNHRFVTVVKAGGDLSTSRLKGALAPDEILCPLGSGSDLAPCFLDIDPRCGFSVRNFQIQACKIATISDIIIYGDDQTPREDLERLANLFAQAQANYREELNGDHSDSADSDDSAMEAEEYNTFVVTDPFSTFEECHPSVVAISSEGMHTGKVLDFLTQERIEMTTLSAPSLIAPNVSLGSTPEPSFDAPNTPNREPLVEEVEYSILVEASDLASMPEQDSLNEITDFLDEKSRRGESAVAHLEVPSSGSFLVSDRGDVCARTLERLLGLCRWMWDTTHRSPSVLPLTDLPPKDDDGDTAMTTSSVPPPSSKNHHILLHCADGYTETTILALAYYIYAHAVPLHAAIVDLHVQGGRNFFAYPTDKHFLQVIEPNLLAASPAAPSPSSVAPEPSSITPPPSAAADTNVDCSHFVTNPRPDWLIRMDGSLPSRVLPHLYLGNLAHATNPALLRALGITRILSVGEPVTFAADEAHASAFSMERIASVQDNGVDALRPNFDSALAYIDDAEREVRATHGARGKVLVHCRVGVSRSATIVIASVMRRLGLTFPRAYCYVRARRLNVIVQPHLRFVYELLGWEEELGKGWGREGGVCDDAHGEWDGRELEWPMIGREIAAMNRPYCRQ